MHNIFLCNVVIIAFMKTKLCIYFTLFGIFITSIPTLYAQELNKEFLNSLPKSVQDEFLNQDDDENISDNYNERPDTRMSKIEFGIDAIKEQVVSLETEINRENITSELQVFGESFFKSYQSSFAPINQENFVSDYVLDVGDVLNIHLIGRTNSKYKVPVSRDGSVNIPKIGIVTVAGMPYEEAIKNIKTYSQSKFLDIEVFVNLESARDMNILLIGNASKPGIYTLPGGSSVLSLLHAAGGISENGSYRSIQHRRNNKLIQEIDLYDILIKGNLLLKSPLRSGDAVIVGAPHKKVSISGGINYPAIYELTTSENFSDLIDLAQNLSPNATDKIKIYRASGVIEDLPIDSISSAPVYNGDSLKISQYVPESKSTFIVEISGAVAKPGKYSFEHGKTLHQLIEEAGGYLDSAYPDGGALYRESVSTIQKENFKKTYNQLINYIASSNQGPVGMSIGASTNLQTILAELKSAKFLGRLAAEFNPAKIFKNPNLDTILASNDKVVIPFFTSDVYVAGDVLQPGGRRYLPDLHYKDYINQSGGLGQFADDRRIVVIRPNGDATVAKSGLFFNDPSISIYPGTTIYVPREIGKIEGISYTATLAPIVSSLALSLASLNSIK